MWDVIVVGAGPAGASAAYFLARAGVKVLLADQQSFPREKTCGDGVSSAGLAILEKMGLAEWVIREGFFEPQSLRLSAPDGSSVAMSYTDAPFSYGRVIPRYVLDEALVERAVAAGANFVENYQVQHFERINAQQVQVRGVSSQQRRTDEAHLVILAEGAQAGLARRMGLVNGPPDLVAVRGYFSGVAGPDDMLEIHYERSIAPGYVWVFPAGNGCANVGLGTFVRQVKRKHLNLEADLRRVMQENPYLRHRLKGSKLESKIKGCPLRTNLMKGSLCADNVLIVGESAHLVNPLTGEGIAPSLESGLLAAQEAVHALENGKFSGKALAPYAREIRTRYTSDHRAALIVRGLLKCSLVTNHLVRRAHADGDLARLMGLAIVGVTSTKALLKPSMVARYLF